MPLAAPTDRNFEDQSGAVGANATVPSGVVAVGASAVIASGNGSGKAIAFRGASGAQLYWQDFLAAAANSDYSEFSGDFMLEALPSANSDIWSAVAGTGTTTVANMVILTSGATLFRDSSSGSTVTGWTNPTLAANVWYRFKFASIKSVSGTSPYDGQIKAQLIRLSDNTVLAQGAGTACNTSTSQAKGATYGKRTATGTCPVLWDNIRISDQAYDWLEEPIPAASGTETFVSTPFSVGYIGDTATDRSGTGTGQNGTVEARLVGTGKFQASEVRVNGLTGRPIELTTVATNGLQAIDNWRNEGFDPGVFVVALGENGAASSQAQQQTWITDLLNKIAAGSRTRYTVYWIGTARRDSADATASTFWSALSAVTAPANIIWIPVNYNALLHNGRDETGFWQSTNSNEAYMTSSGYTTRDSIINSQISRPNDQASLGGTGTLTATSTAKPGNTAALTGQGDLTSVGSYVIRDSAALGGTGTLSTASTAAASGSASLGGTGTLAASGTPATGSTAALSGTGTLAVSGGPVTTNASALSGTGTLAAGAGTPRAIQTAALTGTGTFSSSTTNNKSDTGALSGTGTLSASNRASASGSAALGGTGTLSATGTPLGATSAALTGTGTLATSGTPRTISTAALTGTGTLAATGTPVTLVAPGLTGTGTLTATQNSMTASGQGALAGTGTLTALGKPVTQGPSALAGTGVLSVAGTPKFGGPLALFGQGNLTAVGGVRYADTAALLGTGTLTATGVGTLAQPSFDVLIQGVWFKARTLGVGMNGGLAPVQAV